MAIQIVVLADSGTGMIHPRGKPRGYTVPNLFDLFSNLPQVLADLGPDNRVNVFYAIAHHSGLGLLKPSRSGASYEYQTVLQFDIDHADALRAYEYLNIVAVVLGCQPEHLILISTGNGLHILAPLKTPIRSTKYLAQLKPAYNETLYKIGKEFVKAALPGKLDPVVFDAARVFRLPGTINRKPGQPDKECVLLQMSKSALDIDLMAVSGLDKVAAENILPDQVRRQFPDPDYPHIVQECRFIQWALATPEEVHEPDLFSLSGLMAAMPLTGKAIVEGKEYSPKELARRVHENASSSKSLARQDFDVKYEASSRYGARKCKTIEAERPEICATCPHQSKVPTPLALKSPAHVGSAKNGFWVLTPKGECIRPHYADVTKVYQEAVPYVATGEGRIVSYNRGLFGDTEKLRVEAWLQTKLSPPDNLIDTHCREFVRWVLRNGTMPEEDERKMFAVDTLGKLNCQNGYVDILTGILHPHTPKIGFRYRLPYDYIPDESSEMFLDWLAEVTQHRTELMETLLDLMAYTLWPSYDDHMFAYFVGEGANGKSTLLHLIGAIVGEQNRSALSIHQIAGNRFAPANLEGKLVNLSEESGGGELGFDEMNVIKNLSAGGEVAAERKGVQGFMFQNRAKLIFSANKPPIIREKGLAIQRRMIVIPFDHTIKDPDSTVEHRLLAEVPKITSMLVRRIQDNIKENGGRFLVSRGGRTTEEAQERMLTAGNPVIEWAKEALDFSPDVPVESYVACAEAYSRYKLWSADNGHTKPFNMQLFSFNITRFIVPNSANKEDNRIRVAGKQVRIFKQIRWKEEE